VKAYEFDAVAYEGEVYCVQCLPDGLTVDSNGVHPIFANSEWDCVPVCDRCGMEHTYIVLIDAESAGASC
jgi:hypothetical protein